MTHQSTISSRLLYFAQAKFCGEAAGLLQGELEAARATGELLGRQIVTKVKAVAEHEARAARLESQLTAALADTASLHERCQVSIMLKLF